jgi:single-stranded DNA-specific DHH superfamily exonuclease
LSIRGKNVKGILEKLLKGFEESSGGGHEGAVGARIKTEDVERFRKEFVEISKGGNG